MQNNVNPLSPHASQSRSRAVCVSGPGVVGNSSNIHLGYGTATALKRTCMSPELWPTLAYITFDIL